MVWLIQSSLFIKIIPKLFTPQLLFNTVADQSRICVSLNVHVDSVPKHNWMDYSYGHCSISSVHFND